MIGLKYKHTGQAAVLQAENPWQEQPILWNTLHEPGSPISGKPYRQDTSLTWFPSDTPVTPGRPRTEPWDASFSPHTGCCHSWVECSENSTRTTCIINAIKTC